MITLLKSSTLTGAWVGLIASVIYILAVVPLLSLFIVISNTPGDRLGEAIMGALSLPLCTLPIGIVLGVIPGAIVGAGGGLVIGLSVLPFRSNLTLPVALSLGGMAGVLLVMLAHIPLNFFGAGSFTQGQYLFWLGGPGLVTVGAAIFTAWRVQVNIQAE